MEEINKFQDCIQKCIECAMACRRCASACLKERNVKSMVTCIDLDMACEVVCNATAELISIDGDLILKYMSRQCEICADVCEDCAEECEKFDMQHCRDCAEACRICARACRNMSGN